MRNFSSSFGVRREGRSPIPSGFWVSADRRFIAQQSYTPDEALTESWCEQFTLLVKSLYRANSSTQLNTAQHSSTPQLKNAHNFTGTGTLG